MYVKGINNVIKHQNEMFGLRYTLVLWQLNYAGGVCFENINYRQTETQTHNLNVCSKICSTCIYSIFFQYIYE